MDLWGRGSAALVRSPASPYNGLHLALGPREVFTMIEEMPQGRLHVSTAAAAGPSLMIPLAQPGQVTSLPDRHGVRYWVDSDAISLDGRPAITVVNFGRN